MNKLKILAALISSYILAGCGTNLKVQDAGKVNYNNKTGPVFLVYDFEFPNDRHELFIFDQNDRRYNVKLDGDKKIAKIVYLPLGHKYFINSLLHVKASVSTEFILGDKVKIFEPKKDSVVFVGLFRISPTDKKYDFQFATYDPAETMQAEDLFNSSFQR